MSDPFNIPEKLLLSLKATRSGRGGEGGYNYQRAYAVARLASMRTAETLLNLPDYPTQVRYDWADDLDEVLGDGTVCFTQCKRLDNIGSPAGLSEVLMGFAPKWLWTPIADRTKVRLRLVACDTRFATGFKNPRLRTKVWNDFKLRIGTTPSDGSDRATWQGDADSIGHEPLFDGLWERLEFVYVAKEVIANDPAGALLPAEKTALDHLSTWSVIWGNTRKNALDALRRLIHENLIGFDPDDTLEPALPSRSPRIFNAADVRLALFAKEKDAPLPPFTVVDSLYLSKSRTVERKPFVFQVPEWHHVVHGADDELKFVERDQTDSLAKDVSEKLIEPLRRGTGSLSALFVTGPPGAGKSTLVRRVAAQLIDSGKIVVADAGANLADVVPGGVDEYVRQLSRLVQQGRPVLLLLDDPLQADSEWIDLLKKLKHLSSQLAVLSATPDFLFRKHEHQLRGVQLHRFEIDPPSKDEKRALSKLYGQAFVEGAGSADDFLVLVAEAAEGRPFSEIIRRVWETLNGGKGINNDVRFSDLPWPVRAFWFVCALHRAYIACPLPILQSALDLSGGADGNDIGVTLARLQAQGGWNIFRIFQPENAFLIGSSDLVSSAHQTIAATAWETRPGSWWDNEVYRVLSEATTKVPTSLISVAHAAGALASAPDASDPELARILTGRWLDAAKNPETETRNLCTLTAAIANSGGRELALPMLPELRRRANGPDGWLAALQLFYLSDRRFPDLNLAELIAEADFSIAPARATQFFEAAGHTRSIVTRLFSSLAGELDWQIHPTLLGWAIGRAPRNETIGMIGLIKDWLKTHKDDTRVRVQLLSFIQRLPKTPEFDDLRKQTAVETRIWLADNEPDTHVRTQYLSFIQSLPNDGEIDEQDLSKRTKLDVLREQIAEETESWLDQHPDNREVRTQFLAFIQNLPKDPKLDALRERIAENTEKWLDRHPDSSDVRTQFIAYVQKLPSTFHDLRKRLALSTAEWLRTGPANLDVSTSYVSFLLAIRDPELLELEKDSVGFHKRIIENNPSVYGHRVIFGNQLLRLERFAEARDEFRYVLVREQRHQIALRGYGIAMHQLGEFAEAERSFNQAILWAKRNGGYLAMFYTSRGIFFESLGRWKEAIADFNEAAKESPEYYGNHWGIARVQKAKGNLEKAKESLEMALADPGLRSPEKEEIETLLAEVVEEIDGNP